MAEKKKITICIGSSCFARGNMKNVEVAEQFLKDRGLVDEVDVDLCGGLCLGQCAEGPNVVVDDKVYHHVDTGVMLDILNGLFPAK